MLLLKVLQILPPTSQKYSLWYELHNSYVGPVCTCGAFGKFIEQQKLYWFSGGQNDNQSTCKRNTLVSFLLNSSVSFA